MLTSQSTYPRKPNLTLPQRIDRNNREVRNRRRMRALRGAFTWLAGVTLYATTAFCLVLIAGGGW